MEDGTERYPLSSEQGWEGSLKSSLISAIKGLHQEDIFSPATLAFLVRVAGAALQFGFTVLLAHYYGSTGVGIFVIALSILVISSTIARWGFDQATLKLVASNLVGDHQENVRLIVKFARNVVLTSSTIGMVVLILLSEWLALLFFDSRSMSHVIIILAFAMIPFSLSVLFAEALRGMKRIGSYSMLHGALIPLFSILALIFLRIWVDDIITGAYAYLIASLITMFVGISIWAKFTPTPEASQSKRLDSNNRQELLSISPALAWISIISVAMSFTETFILGIFHHESDVGLYAAALRLALLLNFIIIAFNSILAPNYASLYKKGDLQTMQSLTRNSILVMLGITLPMALVFILFPDAVLSIFGEEFLDAASALILLTVGQLINVLSGPVGILLQMTGREKVFRNNVLIASIATLSSSLLLIPSYAVIGASISAVFGIFLLNALSVFSVRKHLGIYPLSFKIHFLSSH
ncbi:MAG: oligosaccharide flippase family protein [Candidatus Thiodiazotropha sp. (ex Monitilora ramsayi)]|nr:oligosaccharide flippase family protein [Candidatus Thiodiazotropha sp. (ex Monitilora ramsayi)]